MAEHTPADELNVFNEVRRVIDGLIKFDADSRVRIYRTVQRILCRQRRHPVRPAGDGDEGHEAVVGAGRKIRRGPSRPRRRNGTHVDDERTAVTPRKGAGE